MDDEALFTAVRSALLVGTADRGLMVTVWQADNPTTQGRTSGPTIWLHRAMGDRRYGWTRRADDADGVQQEEQLVETTLQINTLDPSPDAYPSDLGNVAIDILQGGVALTALRAAGLAVLRITDLRTPAVRNDQQEFEVTPGFDVTLQHRRKRAVDVPDAYPVTFRGVYRV